MHYWSESKEERASERARKKEKIGHNSPRHSSGSVRVTSFSHSTLLYLAVQRNNDLTCSNKSKQAEIGHVCTKSTLETKKHTRYGKTSDTKHGVFHNCWRIISVKFKLKVQSAAVCSKYKMQTAPLHSCKSCVMIKILICLQHRRSLLSDMLYPLTKKNT